MVKVVKGDKTMEMPGKVITVGIVVLGVCAIVSDVCNAVVKKK